MIQTVSVNLVTQEEAEEVWDLHQRTQPCGYWLVLESRIGDGSPGGRPQRRPPKTVSFGKITIYEFPRVQGFASVPGEGGMTLGMDFRHTEEYTCILGRYADQPCRSPGEFMSSETSLSYCGNATPPVSASMGCNRGMPQKATGWDEGRNGRQQLEPLQWRRRRQLLHASGVRNLDSSESEACRAIRKSRGRCGCHCSEPCTPKSCSCSLDGIPCQVERDGFPCACSEQACENPCGRRQYNPDIMREHYRCTFKRLEFEKTAGDASSSGLGLDAWSQYTRVKDPKGTEREYVAAAARACWTAHRRSWSSGLRRIFSHLSESCLLN
ncbi:cysteine/serine-rich nuclear protein 1-like [Dermacentor albipictus]|uniref:cysteine/serine-rich nuclear protein 1-like n=1 Tax=Dermacentor albipictus TaxID=60249 RepID=UPI0038FCD442